MSRPTYYVTLFGYGRWSGPGLTTDQALDDQAQCEAQCGGRAVVVSDATGEVVPHHTLRARSVKDALHVPPT